MNINITADCELKFIYADELDLRIRRLLAIGVRLGNRDRKSNTRGDSFCATPRPVHRADLDATQESFETAVASGPSGEN